MSRVLTLVQDDALSLHVAPAASPHVDAWLPFSARDASPPTSEPLFSRATITVHSVERLSGETTLPKITPPTLRLGGVDLSFSDTTQRVTLHSNSHHVAGTIDLETLQANIDIVTNTPPSRSGDVASVLTLCAALLLNRLGRALVHAAAIVPPDNSSRAWLLVGDTHAGKTTTTANAITAGWHYLSDDHVVLSIHDDLLFVEGWPRTFHLDAGWRTESPKHHRVDVDPRHLSSAHWRSSAQLGGLLFPAVVAEHPTSLTPISSAEVLAGLVRQSPWLMADRRAAPSVLKLLTAAAQCPARRLTLGIDTFNNPGLLIQRLRVLL